MGLAIISFGFFSCAAILDLMCETFLKKNVSALLFLSNVEVYGSNTAAAQYFLQLASYLRIPVVAWNADNSGLEKVRLKNEPISFLFDKLRSHFQLDRVELLTQAGYQLGPILLPRLCSLG